MLTYNVFLQIIPALIGQHNLTMLFDMNLSLQFYSNNSSREPTIAGIVCSSILFFLLLMQTSETVAMTMTTDFIH